MGSCPNCHNLINTSNHITGKGKPKENDIAVCKKCGLIIVFQNDGNWKVMPESDLQNLSRYEPVTYGILMKGKESILGKKGS